MDDTQKAPQPRQPTTISGFDVEYLEALKDNEFKDIEIPVMNTPQEMRAFGEWIMKIALEKEAAAYPPPAESVVETVVEVKSFDGATITVSRFSLEQHRVPLAKGQPLRPAVYHVHGGGMITGSVDLWRPLYVRNVAMWDVQVFAVDYRVAPENQAPGPVEDSFAGLKWLSENALSLGVDPARLVIYGDSAGGGIAAGTTILARDRGLEPPLAKQILVYPMIDDRTKYGSDWPVREFLAWTEKDNLIGWTAYLGADRAGREDADVSIYEAPGRATPEDLVGLPRTYIDTAGFDLFRDDNLQYAARLLQAGVEVEFHLYPGVPHGFEKATSASVVKRAMENRRLAIATV